MPATRIVSYDGARMLFLADGIGEPAAWATGDYSITFTFALDLGDDDHVVLYKARSSTTQEFATISFALGGEPAYA